MELLPDMPSATGVTDVTDALHLTDISYRMRAWAEISLDALAHNVSQIQQRLTPGVQLCAVVKADAYGHGEAHICKKLYALGVRFYAVSSFEEAVRVRRWCPEGEILILGCTAPECSPLLAEYRIIQTVFSEAYAQALSDHAAPGMPVLCHIKLDTGMGRIGLPAKEEVACLAQIEHILHMPGIQADGIFTHFAVADEDSPCHQAYTQEQEALLFRIYQKLQAQHVTLRHVHCMNSAGICYRNLSGSTLARAGIILYGLLPNAALPVPLHLQPVLSLYSRISHVKTVQPGDCISYGRTYTAKSRRHIATVTIGYADGYARLLSGRAEVLVRGVRCRVTGRVCMDQMMIDVTDVPGGELTTGEIVTLIGQDGTECITADMLAGWADTIGYEIVCGISKRIPRIFTEHGTVIHEDKLI